MERKLGLAVIVAFLLVLLPVSAFAEGQQEYPTRPIQYIVPWGPENESVAMARVIAEDLSEELGVKVTVTAMPGGSGSKGLKHVLSQPADGYTILDAWVAPLIFVVLNRPDIGYTHEDFTPIGHTTFMPFSLVIRNDDDRFSTYEEFVEYGQNHPGEMKYNATGAVSVPHAAMTMFLQEANIEAEGVPYPGLAGGVKDFLGGTLDFTIGNPWVKETYGDQTKTLAFLTDERMPWYPEIPTVKELGHPTGLGKAGMGWDSLVVKAGTPQDRVEMLREAYREVITRDEMQQRLRELGYWVRYMPPEETKQLWEDSATKLKDAVEVLKGK